MARKQGQTWIELAVRNGGFRQAFKALGYAYAWAVAREAIDHDPTVEEYADWWNAPIRSAFREQAAFRACFPQLDTPAAMFEDPKVRAGLRDLARELDRLEGKVRALKGRIRPSESSILQIGMEPANLAALGEG